MAIEKPNWFRMDPAKFLSDAQVDVMSTLELGACFRLMCRQWIDGSIPDDQRLLTRLCRLDAEEMGQAWVTLAPFFPLIEPGKRANRFMWLEREKVIADLERKSDEGTRAARKRWDEAKKGNGIPSAIANGSPMPEAMQEQNRVEQNRVENTFPQTPFADAPAILSNHAKNSKPTQARVERLYSLYPRKRDKLAAKKAIAKATIVVMGGDADHPAMPVDDALDYLAQRVTLYAERVRSCDPDFIPYPASWFNAGAFWDDERDWGKKPNGKPPAGVALPDNYIPPSEQIRRERAGVSQ
jgi:uncharacterized protein YdaU (DUF1376 family)